MKMYTKYFVYNIKQITYIQTRLALFEHQPIQEGFWGDFESIHSI